MGLLKKLRERVQKRRLEQRAGRQWTCVVLPELQARPPRRYLSVATVIKDEAQHVPEWLDFHLRRGVEHVYIYDNGSRDDLAGTCRPYVEAGRVTLVPWATFSVWSNTQRSAYAHALANFGVESTWMGFFDLDEFMFPVEGSSLVEVLRAREHLPVLAVTGIHFGTGGHRHPPQEGVARGYRHAVPLELQRQHADLMYTKCFVQAPRIEAAASAHWFRIRGDDACGYTEHGVPLRGKPRDFPALLTADVIRYNHYFTRSVEEFERKCQIAPFDVRTRMRSAQAGAGAHAETARRRRHMFELIERLAVEDLSIQRLL